MLARLIGDDHAKLSVALNDVDPLDVDLLEFLRCAALREGREDRNGAEQGGDERITLQKPDVPVQGGVHMCHPKAEGGA